MTQTAALQFLLIDDDAEIRRIFTKVLEREGYRVTVESTAEAGLRRLSGQQFDALWVDLNLPGLSGWEFLRTEAVNAAQCPVVLITGEGNTQTAIQAMREGAFDYLTKPFEVEDLLEIARKVGIARATAKAAQPVLFDEAEDNGECIVGRCRKMEDVYKLIGKVSGTEATVLITGETGTGKELVARALHQNSRRSHGPMVVVNCGAIPEALLESELFGHEKGAFTGAMAKRRGLLQAADGGTVFLDEVGELPLIMQVKLLRFLQDHVVQAVGGNSAERIDVRVVCATNRDLLQETREGRFREDLYYRLKVAHIALPPLRERGSDALLLLKYFNRRASRELNCRPLFFTQPALDLFCSYSWPGNVRQLENMVKQLLVHCSGGVVDLVELEPFLSGQPAAVGVAADIDRGDSLEAGIERWAGQQLERLGSEGSGNLFNELRDISERKLLAVTLAFTHGHQSRAAQLLGITMKTLREKLMNYGLHPKQQR